MRGVLLHGPLLMTSEDTLQSLYTQLFGADSEDEDFNSVTVPISAVQNGPLCCDRLATKPAVGHPVTFQKPAGLILFRRWVSQQKQAGIGLQLQSLVALPATLLVTLTLGIIGAPVAMHQKTRMAERQRQPGDVVWSVASMGSTAC